MWTSDLSLSIIGEQVRVCVPKNGGYRHGVGVAVSPNDSLPEGRFSNNIYRAKRTVKDLIMCNKFDLFGTFTISESNFDRFDLKAFKSRFSAWIKAFNRAHACAVKYILIPEQHANGAWHMHGVLSGIPENFLTSFEKGKHPKKLVDGDFYNWQAYAKKFGFCSLAPIRDKNACASYVSAYITKSLTGSAVEKNSHLYLASKGLQKPLTHLERGVKFESDLFALGFYENDWCYILTVPKNELDILSVACPQFDISAKIKELESVGI